jgi:hypothetical protein
VHTPIAVGALHTIRMNVVVTVLILKLSLTSRWVLDMASFRGKITPSNVGSPTDDRAQLTCRNCIQT